MCVAFGTEPDATAAATGAPLWIDKVEREFASGTKDVHCGELYPEHGGATMPKPLTKSTS
jgi:hypothetical protein